MRIGIDARPLSYRLTGIGFYLKYLLDEIQKIDINNCYFLISNAPIHYHIKNPLWTKIEGRCKKKLLSTLWMQTRGTISIAGLNLDLFWGPRHHLPVLLPKRIKAVITVHDIVHRKFPETMALPNLLVERLLMRRSLLRSDAIMTDSDATAADIEKYYAVDAEKILTIHPGTPKFAPQPGDNNDSAHDLPAKYFLFVGTLDPRKNFRRIFKSFERIDPGQNDVHMVIVGARGWEKKDLFRELKQHPLSSNIHLKGYVSRKQLAHYYKNALCLLFPSLYEGFGFPILEAMYCGTPVITANTSSMPEVAGDAAVLVDPYDIQAMADAMGEVLGNRNLRDRLRQKGRERIKQFDWKQTAVETLRFFESVVGK
jgi:glycosyltransferase involved in cell wall biosynthesis